MTWPCLDPQGRPIKCATSGNIVAAGRRRTIERRSMQFTTVDAHSILPICSHSHPSHSTLTMLNDSNCVPRMVNRVRQAGANRSRYRG